MIITINTFAPGTPGGTYSALYLADKFLCLALEPVIPIIPVGTWPLLMVNSPTWTPKLGSKIPWIAWGVSDPTPDKYESPENKGRHALIHPGTTFVDTVQCIIPRPFWESVAYAELSAVDQPSHKLWTIIYNSLAKDGTDQIIIGGKRD
jgi:hypothetical protein